MAFANDKPTQSITWPPGAGTGDTRIVVGANTPPELLAYGIQVAIIFYISDAITGIEEGYAFIGSSNVLDTGSKNVMLMGEVVYPVPGNPASATAANVRTHFQIDLNQSDAVATKATVFKDEIVQFNNTVPHINFFSPVNHFTGTTDFAGQTTFAGQFDVDGNGFYDGQQIFRNHVFIDPATDLNVQGTLWILGTTFLGFPNASPGTTPDTGVTNGTTTSTSFVNSLTTSGARGQVFTAPPSGSVFVWGSAGGGNSIAASYTLCDFEIRAGSTPGAGALFQGGDGNSCSQVQSAIANSTITHNVQGNVQGLNPGTVYNATLVYAVASGGGGSGTGTFNRRRVSVLPTL